MKIRRLNMPRKTEEGEPTNGYGDWRKGVLDEYREALSELTAFQRRFVEAYLKADSGAEAARIAGSSAKNLEQVAWNTKQLPQVQKALALGMDCRIQAAALDDNEVIMNFREIFHKAMESGDYNAANRSSEHLGKILGLFGDTKGTDRKIAAKAKELRDEKAAQREQELDDGAHGMLEILRNSKLKEGTAEDTRDIIELDADEVAS